MKLYLYDICISLKFIISIDINFFFFLFKVQQNLSIIFSGHHDHKSDTVINFYPDPAQLLSWDSLSTIKWK